MGKRPLCVFSCICLAAVICFLKIFEPIQVRRECPGAENGLKVTAAGKVYYREQKKKSTVLYLQDVHLSENPERIHLNYLVIYLSDKKKYPIGTIIKADGKLYAADRARNPGQFDERLYLKSRGFSCKMLADSAEILSDAGNVILSEKLVCLKEDLCLRLDILFEEREAQVLKAMLFGVTDEMPEEVKADWQAAGIGHLLSISGLHVTLLGGTLYRLLRRIGCPYVFCGALSGGVLLCYVDMLGFRVSVVRAVGMFLVFLGAELTGRAFDRLTALALMGISILAVYPWQVKTAGFWMSFLAAAGACVALEWIQEQRRVKEEEKYLRQGKDGAQGKEKQNARKEGLWIPIYIQAAVLPVQLMFYYEIPVYALLWNVCLVPLAAFVLGGSLLALSLSFLSWTAGIFAGASAQLLLEGFTLACRIGKHLPGSVYICGRPRIWQALLYYVILFACTAVFWPEKKGKKRRGRKRLFVCLYIIVLYGLVFMRFHAPVEVTFLDVGQGDCAVIREKGGKVIMIDAGSSDSKEVGNRRLIPFLKYSGISRLDYVFVSHGDADHISGIEELLNQEDISVSHLVCSRNAGTEIYGLKEEAKQQIRMWSMSPGDCLKLEALNVRCLGPWGTEISAGHETENNRSLILMLEAEGSRFLFTGDMEQEEERLLLERYSKEHLRADVLKVAHHGSKTSSSERFLALVSPQIAVVSCGKNNSYGHPHEELLERLRSRGSEILITYETGAVTFRVDEKGVKVVKHMDENLLCGFK